VAHNTTHIAFIGFGEVGQRFARDLSAVDGLRLSTYDIVFDDHTFSANHVARAAALGVVVATDAATACRGADIVISAVTADQTARVAETAARFLTPGQVFLDVNSASPATKQRAAKAVEASGAAYIEGAVMAAVLTPGIRVPILTGGPAAEQVSERLNALGMNLSPVAREHGRASAIKLCRSIVIKGLEALMVDCAAATRHFGVESEVYASLAGTFPSIDWPALAEDMNERVATHGIRRAAEMREAADMLRESGLVPALAEAVAAAHQRGAAVSRKRDGGQ
jgi:3-hydroxyisobutyrate dehydrogenase-like beta-hydroxyacid dehydrogenase